jgi:hypothetical protein
MFTIRQYKFFYSIVTLFLFFVRVLHAQDRPVISDSLLKTLPQYHTKGLLKVHWLFNRPNTPWYIPNGAVYEGTWGKKTTYDIGATFTKASSANNSYEIAAFVGTSYYFRRAKNNYTFKGFFVRTGLAYSSIETTFFYRRSYGVLTGFGYQTPIWKKLHLEVSYATLFGRYEQKHFDAVLDENRWDGFKWNDMAIRVGYQLF